MSNIVSMLQNKSAQFLKQRAYLFLADGKHETAHLTYGELDQKARAIAAYLRQKKLSQQRVLLLYPTGIDFIIAFFGCLYAGVTAVPVNCPEDALEKSKTLLNTLALDADIAGIFTNTQSLSIVKNCFKDLMPHKKFFIEDSTFLLAQPATNLPLPAIHDETIAYLQYTSGSTSTPKAAIITHKNLTHSLKATGKIWRYTKKKY